MRRVEDWLRQAERALEEAEYTFRGEYYELTCFLSQQSAEFAIKALLQSKGIERRGNSLLKLSELIPSYEEVKECLIFLDKQYISSRYPNSYAEGAPYEYYTRKDGEECINCAKKILNWVKGKLSS